MELLWLCSVLYIISSYCRLSSSDQLSCIYTEITCAQYLLPQKSKYVGYNGVKGIFQVYVSHHPKEDDNGNNKNSGCAIIQQHQNKRKLNQYDGLHSLVYWYGQKEHREFVLSQTQYFSTQISVLFISTHDLIFWKRVLSTVYIINHTTPIIKCHSVHGYNQQLPLSLICMKKCFIFSSQQGNYKMSSVV